MAPRVLTVEYANDYKLLITFTNNEIKLFDLSAYLNYPVYEPLKDEAFCKKVKTDGGVLLWDENIDFDPDTLYLESRPVTSFANTI